MTTWRELFTVRRRYPNPVDQRRAVGLLWMTWASALAWLVVSLINVPDLIRGTIDVFYLLAIVLPPIPLYFIYRFIQNGALNRASVLFVALTIIGTAPTGEIDATDLLLLTVSLTTAGLLLTRWGFLAAAAVVALIFFMGLSLSKTSMAPGDLAFAGVIALLDVAFLYAFNSNAGETVTESLVDARRLRQVSEFLAQHGADETEDGILSRAINLLYEQFGYTSAQFYLLDEGGRLERRTHTGLGPELVSARETLTLDAASAVSEAARTRSPVTVTPADNPIRRSHLLPASTAGLSVPLIGGERVIGVLDVQSDTLSRFNEVQTATLELLANPIALLLAQARDREIARRDVEEQGQIVASLRGQLQQLRQTRREDIGSMWGEYLQQRGEPAIGYDLQPGESPVTASDLPETLRSALQSGQPQVETVGDERVIKVPIILRGEVLGAMAFAVPKEQAVGERQLEMAQDISSRLALALETRQLFERTEAQALRERKASETANLLISATDVRAVLNLAAESFNQALGAVRTHIYVHPGLLADLSSPDGSART